MLQVDNLCNNMVWVSEDNAPSEELAAKATLKTKAKCITIAGNPINIIPCVVRVKVLPSVSVIETAWHELYALFGDQQIHQAEMKLMDNVLKGVQLDIEDDILRSGEVNKDGDDERTAGISGSQA